MNITELDQYSLQDAVKFHDRLNPRLWGKDEHLLPEVAQKLLATAADFQEFLGVPDLDVVDITISGSNAAYSYTPTSDIDLHLVVRMPDANSDVYQELFNAKKYQYNDEHDIRIGGADVELYVQPADQAHHSQGIYSVRDSEWRQIPRRRRAAIDDHCVTHKTEDLGARIDQAIATEDEGVMQRIWDKIKSMRQAGLEQQGEFGCDNLVFKMLRRSGHIERLRQAKTAAHDRELSLQERKRKRPRVRYGFGGYWYPGFGYGGESGEGGGDGGGESVREGHQGQPYSSPDGVAASTQMFLNETDQDQFIEQFIHYTADRLGIESMPSIELHRDDDWAVANHSFGRYDPESHSLHVNLSGRHIMDVLRTTAHELAHCRQHEIAPLPDSAGNTGSPWEDEAHAVAGEIMRDWADQHPELFDPRSLEESASGYIPKNRREAKMPQYAMALSVDIQPGEVGRQANKLGLKTGRNGEPGLLMKSANLQEGRMPQPSQGQARYRDLNEPLGPETPPTMPQGTVRVDVSDMYDWYKLGQHISNMKGLGRHDFGKGPPSTIFSFGDEDLEHQYIDALKRTGLTTTDIDPAAHDPKSGQKTDPTYNVDEDGDLVESLRQEFELLEDEFIGEIRMSPTNLRAEAAKTGALAGMEFEMIVPGAEESDAEPEPDFDQDERCRSISDAVDFFHDGEYNGRRDVERLENAMQEDYYEWLAEKIDEDFTNDSTEYIYQYLVNNVSQEEIGDIIGEDLSDADVVTKEQAAKAAELVNDNELQPYFDNAKDQHREDYNDAWDESDWLDATDLDTMQSVYNAYDIAWPHWNFDTGSSVDIDSVAQDFGDAVGMPVNASSSYHGARREPGKYVVEPDGSLDPENNGDMGLEFVSPPMPIDQMLDQLKKVREWAGRNGCYTNRSTGLHINVSVPEFSRDKLDYVKLALLLGDEYVLDQFGRSSNTYARSALEKVRELVRDNPQTARALLDRMRGHMEDLATKAIHSGDTSKYTSINTKDGYIEFRSPGGDWLDENFDKVENTLLRFTVALKAAMDPEAYREEYLKKLYRLLEPTTEKDSSDTVRYFADYVAGKIPQTALRSFVKQARLKRDIARGTVQNQLYWWRVYKDGKNSPNSATVEVVASSKDQAIDKAGIEWNIFSAENRNRMDAEPVRPYDTSPLKATLGEPQAIGQRSGATLNGRPSNPDGNAYIAAASDPDVPLYRYMAAGTADAQLVLDQWKAQYGDNFVWRPDHLQIRGQPGQTPAQAPDTVTDIPPRQTDYENMLGMGSQAADANWEIVDRSNYQPIFLFIANTAQDALRVHERWLQAMGYAQDSEDYGFRERARPGSTLDIQRRRAAQSAQAAVQSATQSQDNNRLWQIVNSADGEVAYEFYLSRENNQQDANEVGLRWVRNNGDPTTTYSVREQPQQTGTVTPQNQQGSVQWRILINGQEIHRFWNRANQGEANAAASAWVGDQIRRGLLSRDQVSEIEIVPVMDSNR